MAECGSRPDPSHGCEGKSAEGGPDGSFRPLVSKLRRADYEYYKRITGLKMLIDFPGYTSEIEAKIPYDTDPIAFYKWWRKGKHEHVVYLSLPTSSNCSRRSP